MTHIISPVFSTYKLVLEFSETKIQCFPHWGIFPAASSHSATGQQMSWEAPADGVTAQELWGGMACARESCCRERGTWKDMSLEGQLMMPFIQLWAVRSLGEEGSTSAAGLSSLFHLLIVLTLWNTRLALPGWDNDFLEARASHRQLDFSSLS